MVSWKEYYMHVEQHRDRECEATRRRIEREVRFISGKAPWSRLLVRTGSLLISWGESLQAQRCERETEVYQGIQRTAHPVV